MICNIIIGNRCTGKTYNAIKILNRYGNNVLYVSHTGKRTGINMYGKDTWSNMRLDKVSKMFDTDFIKYDAILFDDVDMSIVRQMLEKFKDMDIFLMFVVPLYKDGERIV